MRLRIPVDPKPSRFQELLGSDVSVTTVIAAIGHLVIASRSAALVAPPCPAEVLRLTLAAINRAQPIEGYARRLPHETIDNNLGARCIFTDCNVGIARRAFLAAISRTFLF